MNKNTSKKSSEPVVRRHWIVRIEESSAQTVILKARGKTATNGEDYASFFCPAGWGKERIMKEIKSILRGIGAANKENQ